MKFIVCKIHSEAGFPSTVVLDNDGDWNFGRCYATTFDNADDAAEEAKTRDGAFVVVVSDNP